MVGVGGSNPLVPTNEIGSEGGENHSFDKIVWNNFELCEAQPEG